VICPLDLEQVAPQVEEMAASSRCDCDNRQRHLAQAMVTLCDKSIDIEQLKKKIATREISWMPAIPVEALANKYKPIAPPDNFTVIATDGSQIDVDRHHSTRYFLINIGGVYLRYGDNPEAELTSSPRLYFDKTDLVMTSPDNHEIQVEGNLLGIKRDIEEYRHLAQMASSLTDGRPTLALSDGTLIRLTLKSKDIPEFVVEEFLEKGFLKCLDDIKKLGESKKIAPASYISFPSSTDVVGTIRIAICPRETPNCDQCRKNSRPGEYECNPSTAFRTETCFKPCWITERGRHCSSAVHQYRNATAFTGFTSIMSR
jgi:hypothetical protein